MIYQAVNILWGKNMGFKTPRLRPNLYDYSNVYNVVKETLGLGVFKNDAVTQKNNVFKNNAPFRLCI